jgi:cell division protein FtsW (lipid II flippase)
MVINVAKAIGVFPAADIPLPFISYGCASMATSMLNALDISYVIMRRYLFQDDPIILNPSVREDRTVI